mgnify:CR=1 FL=1
MQLKKLFENINYSLVKGSLDLNISDIFYDSRKCINDSVFVCLKGCEADGHKFITAAISRGAVAVVVSDDIKIDENITVIKVDDTRVALAFMSAAFFEYPASQLKTVAITGTKGKTTVSCMIRTVLQKAGIKTGLIGTLGVIIGNEVIKTVNTTPESYEIQKFLRQMVDNGCKCAVMEASSLGLKWHRMDGFVFDYGVFTNFSMDHIGGNEHENMQEYLECKGLLFKQCKLGLINIDDKNYRNLLKGHTCEIETYGFSQDSDIMAFNEKLISQSGYVGIHFETSGKIALSVNVDIPGKFSVYNALAAISVCHHFNIPEKSIIDGLNEVKVKGRIESVPVNGNFTLLIDYAHNALSMENVLTTLREYRPNRLITLFGAGGNRPKIRRYEMGEVSGKLSDLSVVTADNSRNEDVMDIISDIEVGLRKTRGKFIVIPDRKEAIKYCISIAKDNDIIVLAGKGHEDYQEIKGQRIHFDEREVISDILKELSEVQ